MVKLTKKRQYILNLIEEANIRIEKMELHKQLYDPNIKKTKAWLTCGDLNRN